MFRSKSGLKEAESISESNNIIGKGSLITGDIDAEGNVRVEGKIDGNITSKKKVAIGADASITGNITAMNAELAGEVNGTVEVMETLILKASCTVNGDISAGKLIVEAGATLNGACRMGASIKNLSLSDAESQKAKSTPKRAVSA